MTTPVTTATSANAAQAAGAAGHGARTSATRLTSQLETPQLFIKLFMTELQHQDPTNPATPASIAQQTAELSQMEASMSLTTAIKSQERYAEDAAATGLIGKSVTATVTGATVSGKVTDILLASSGTPVLKVGQTTVPLSAVSSVGT